MDVDHTLPPASESLATDRGVTLGVLSRERPAFAVLLRHGGCPFHREALVDLRKAKAAIEASGVQLVVVHMDEGENPAERSGRYDLSSVPHVSDPDQSLYRQLGLPRGSVTKLFGPKEIVRGFAACMLKGHGVGPLTSDVFQLGGMALIDAGEVVWKRALRSAADHPDYVAAAREAMAARSTPTASGP
ncbi:MAG: AhpC/TSA family protein [Lacipirellulaceae bacterium]